MSASQEDRNGPSVSAGRRSLDAEADETLAIGNDSAADHLGCGRSPPPRYPYPASEASSSTSLARAAGRPAPPPPFPGLYEYASAEDVPDHHFEPPPPSAAVTEAVASAATAAPAYAPSASRSHDNPATEPSREFQNAVLETKRALPPDTKGEPSGQRADDGSEPPPAYSEGYSPLLSFTYLMAAAGGASSIITQVQQGGPPINALGGNFQGRRTTAGGAKKFVQMSAPMRR